MANKELKLKEEEEEEKKNSENEQYVFGKKIKLIRQDVQYSLNKLCLKHLSGKNPGSLLITGLN